MSEHRCGQSEDHAKDVRTIFKQHHIRYTKMRAHLYAILSQARQPLDARTLFEQVKEIVSQDPDEKEKGVWLSTVYRSLEMFTECDLLEKMVRPGDDQATYVLKPATHEHYAVCTSCNHIFDIVSCPEETWRPELEAAGFHMTGHRIEVYGLCDECYNARLKEAGAQGKKRMPQEG